MTWLTTFYLRAFVILAQVAQFYSDENGPMPGFKEQPIDTLIDLSNQTIFCAVKGDKPLAVSWRKEEKLLDNNLFNYFKISQEGALTLFYTNRKRDEGSYRCIVENKFGAVISQTAHITFPYMNEFSGLDTRVTVNEGQRVLLACNAPDSYPDKNIYWSKSVSTSSFPLQLESSSHYSISEEGDLYFSYVTEKDKGVYYCSVENNNLRRVLKRTVVVFVNKVDTHTNVAPKVWLFNDQVAMKNSNFMMECIAHGRPVPAMAFRHATSGTELKGARQMGNRLRYEFGRFEEQHEGDYICEVNNVYGETHTAKAYIKMEAKPVLVTQSGEISEAVDSTVKIPCVGYGKPQVQYTWFKDGKVLSNNQPGISIINGNLTINRVMEHDKGFYQCLAYNRHGEDLMTLRFIVVVIPAGFGALSIRPAPTTHALLGGSIEINCVPTGAPKPSVKWQRKNQTEETLLRDARVSVSSVGTLKIKNIKNTDAGEYECLVTNRLGSAKRAGRVVVKSGLAITEQLTEKDTIIIGDKIQFKCNARSDGKKELIYKWYKGTFSHKRRLINNKRTKIIYDKLKRQSLLEIIDAKSSDAGTYMCIVEGTQKVSDIRSQMILVVGPNGHEVPDLATRPSGFKTTTVEQKKNTKLVLKGPPEPPSDVTATEQTDGTNIKISWTKGSDNSGPITKYHIQARTTYSLDTWHDIRTSNKTTKYRVTEIVSLSPWVEYKVRVLAENKYGISKPSVETEKWIRTPIAAPLKYPKNIIGKGTGPNEITVSFEPLELIDQNAPGIEYIIHYKEKYSTYETQKAYVEPGKNIIKLKFRNSDSYYKPYEFQVQAVNSVNEGPLSPKHTAYSGERFPLGIPENLHVKVTSATCANASWDEVDRSRLSMRGKFLGYKFLYWVEPLPNHPQVEQYKSTKSNEIQVKLAPYTNYYFQVIVFNSAGDGPTGETIGPLRTPEGKPSKPSNFKVIEAVKEEATLSWNEPLHKNGKILNYRLKYRLLPYGRLYEKVINIDERILILKNLISNAKYYFSLSAVTIAGIGETEEITFDFAKVPSVRADKPSIASIGYNAIVLTWTPIRHLNISGYKVFYWSKDESQIRAIALWDRDESIVSTIHGLQEDTTYNFQIAVVNKYGTGPKSEVVQAHTKSKFNEPSSATTKDGKTKSSSSSRVTFNNYVLLLVIITALLVPR